MWPQRHNWFGTNVLDYFFQLHARTSIRSSPQAINATKGAAIA
jgi:hypothetical protein